MQVEYQPAKALTPPPISPGDLRTGETHHCERVALWCDELARLAKLTHPESRALRQAALIHHNLPISSTSLENRLGELATSLKERFTGRSFTPTVEQILSQFLRPTSGADAKVTEISELLMLANSFDEQLEYSRCSDADLDTLVAEADRSERIPNGLRRLMSGLRKCSLRDLEQSMSRLPVYPVVVLKLTKLLAKEDVGVAEIERVAKQDQVISGKVMQLANSALYSPASPIRTLSQAITFIGLDDAKKAFLACGIQRLYAHPRLYAVWQHSIEAAHTAERIARLSGRCEPSEAFLMGLLHDVGALAIGLLREEVYLGIQRLRSNGCDTAVAEKLVCGFDHAEAGAEILKHWNFSKDLQDAVRCHHSPERTDSTLASILYLTEFWTNSEEDFPSSGRLTNALKTAGLTLAQLGSNSSTANVA